MDINNVTSPAYLKQKKRKKVDEITKKKNSQRNLECKHGNTYMEYNNYLGGTQAATRSIRSPTQERAYLGNEAISNANEL